ncbi:hypothetical protein [Phytoactinopolyspora alkaliphila]|uniref:hypothetical protein n=1 Tax=Phytoactinopolyspora alkaliphila TaxID=1783498 RepID=UPI001C20A26C|nr:hypothetical protein [Phytoactinopolyspora alkaliphila]
MTTISLNGLDVSRIGLGMSAFFTGAGSGDTASIAHIHWALDAARARRGPPRPGWHGRQRSMTGAADIEDRTTDEREGHDQVRQ